MMFSFTYIIVIEFEAKPGDKKNVSLVTVIISFDRRFFDRLTLEWGSGELLFSTVWLFIIPWNQEDAPVY